MDTSDGNAFSLREYKRHWQRKHAAEIRAAIRASETPEQREVRLAKSRVIVARSRAKSKLMGTVMCHEGVVLDHMARRFWEEIAEIPRRTAQALAELKREEEHTDA